MGFIATPSEYFSRKDSDGFKLYVKDNGNKLLIDPSDEVERMFETPDEYEKTFASASKLLSYLSENLLVGKKPKIVTTAEKEILFSISEVTQTRSILTVWDNEELLVQVIIGNPKDVYSWAKNTGKDKTLLSNESDFNNVIPPLRKSINAGLVKFSYIE